MMSESGDQASAASQAGGLREGRGSHMQKAICQCLCPVSARTRCARLLSRRPGTAVGTRAGVTSTRRLTFALRMSSERTCCGEVGAGADIFGASSRVCAE